MRKVTFGLVVLGVLALAFISMPMRAQNQGYPFPGYPPEFAPSRTVRTLPPAPPLVPPAKFNKRENAVPNQYIIVLNDDAVSLGGTADERRARVANLARGMLPAGAEIRSVYGTGLRGFCAKLPNEAVAIALSNDPRVKYVESDGLDGSSTDCITQPNAPAGLARICKTDLSLVDGTYTYCRTGSGVTVYDVGPGVRKTHHEFDTQRAFIAVDKVAPHAPDIQDQCTVTPDNNDCNGHGTRMLGLVGGTIYGVAKSASVGSVKVWFYDAGHPNGNIQASIVLEGLQWITDHHNANPTQLEVANCSFQMGTNTTVNNAVVASIQ